ncbi:MAG: hypothetical protein ABI120_09015 [Gemmatimonadaceae bacterium]
MSGGTATMVFGPDLTALFARYRKLGATELAQIAEFWDTIRANFKLTPDSINLENGYYCFQPEEVLEQFISHVRMVTVAINNARALSVRVTPQIYTSVAELDAFVKALKEMAA